MIIKVEVKPEHIAEGVKKDSRHCPIALALLEETNNRYPNIKPHAVFADFTACYIASDGEDRYLEFGHGVEIAGFIERFDNEENVRPMSIVYQVEDREEAYTHGTAELRQDDEPEPD